MRKAVIDVGTNSILLLVADVLSNGSLEIVCQDFKISRLGSGLKREGKLTAEAIDRAIDILVEQVGKARALQSKDIAIIATEGMRQARNKNGYRNNRLSES